MILPAGRDGDGSALVVFLASIRCSVWGHSDPHAGRIDVHIAPDVGATSFGSPPVANRAHRRSNLGHSARGVAVAAQLQGWMLAWAVFGEHLRSFPNISGLTGGECGEGRATVSLGRAPPRRVCCSGVSAAAMPFPSIGGRSTSLLRFSRRKESNEVGH